MMCREAGFDKLSLSAEGIAARLGRARAALTLSLSKGDGSTLKGRER